MPAALDDIFTTVQRRAAESCMARATSSQRQALAKESHIGSRDWIEGATWRSQRRLTQTAEAADVKAGYDARRAGDSALCRMERDLELLAYDD